MTTVSVIARLTHASARTAFSIADWAKRLATFEAVPAQRDARLARGDNWLHNGSTACLCRALHPSSVAAATASSRAAASVTASTSLVDCVLSSSVKVRIRMACSLRVRLASSRLPCIVSLRVSLLSGLRACRQQMSRAHGPAKSTVPGLLLSLRARWCIPLSSVRSSSRTVSTTILSPAHHVMCGLPCRLS